MTMTKARKFLLNNTEVLETMVQEINSWDGELEYLEVSENDEDFFYTFFENDVNGAVRAIAYGDFNINHDLVRFDGYANLETLSYADYREELKDNIDEILEVIVNNLGSLNICNDELESILNEI